MANRRRAHRAVTALAALTALFVSRETSAVQTPYHELYGDWPLIGKIAAAPFNAYSIGTLGGNCRIQGTLLFQSSGGLSKCLGVGPAGQVLVSAGAGADLTWAAVTTAASQAQNLFWASPNGSSGTPSFRAIVSADLPSLSVQAGSQTGHFVFAAPLSAGNPSFRALVANDLPVINNSSVPTPTASALGGVESLICAASNWLNAIALTGVPTCAQPKYSDIIGVPPVVTTYTGIATAHTYGKAFEISGYATAGDGGDALMVPAYALLRVSTGAAGCSTQPSQCVTDGITNSTTTITSISAIFNAFDVGRPISDTGGCIPGGDTIASVSSVGTALLQTAATGACAADTFNFGSVAANSPGYTTDADSNPVMYAPSRNITPQMFGATPQIVGSVDSGPALQKFLDATQVIAQYGGCGFIGTRFYDNATQLKWNIAHGNAPCLYDSSPFSDDIQFGSGTASPNFQVILPGATGGTQGGAGTLPPHSTFYWQLRIKLEGNTAGVVAAVGDYVTNNDAHNGIILSMSAVNDNYLGTACAFAGIFNSESFKLNCVTAKRANSTDTNATLTATTLTDAALGMTSADVGATVTFPAGATANTYCPPGIQIASVASGVATLNETCNPASGLSVKLDGGIDAGFYGGNESNNITGILSGAAYQILLQDFGPYFTSNNVFSGLDFDASGAIAIIQTGAARNNTFIGSDAQSANIIACGTGTVGAVQEKIINYEFNNGYGWNMAVGSSVAAGSFVVGNSYTITFVGTTSFTAIGAAANTVGLTFTATGAGTGTGTATAGPCAGQKTFFFDAPGVNLAGGTNWLPNPPCGFSTQCAGGPLTYTNNTGQTAFLYGKGNSNMTGVTVNGVNVVGSGITTWFAIVPSGQTFLMTCSASCLGAVLAEPMY